MFCFIPVFYRGENNISSWLVVVWIAVYRAVQTTMLKTIMSVIWACQIREWMTSGGAVWSQPSVAVTKTTNQMSTGFAVHILRIKSCFSMVCTHISTMHIYIFQNGIIYTFYYHLSFAWKCSLIRPIGFVVHQLSISPVASPKENNLCMR